MTNQETIVEKLSLFNNMSFTKKQWDIILKGCGCPKSHHFWTALKQSNIVKESKLFTLIDINNESFIKVWELYCTSNRESVKKAYNKAKIKKEVQRKRESFQPITLYMVDGVLTTIKPIRDL